MAFDTGIGMIDGIAAFDISRGMYYYATDTGSANIYSVNVKKEAVGETLVISEAYIIQK